MKVLEILKETRNPHEIYRKYGENFETTLKILRSNVRAIPEKYWKSTRGELWKKIWRNLEKQKFFKFYFEAI